MRENKILHFNRELDSLLHGGRSSTEGLPAEDQRALELARQLAGMDPGARSQVRLRLRKQLVERSYQLERPASIASAWTRLRLNRGMIAMILLVALVGWVFNSIAQSTKPGESSTITAYATDTAMLVSVAPTQPTFNIEAIPLVSDWDQSVESADASNDNPASPSESEWPGPKAIPTPTVSEIEAASPGPAEPPSNNRWLGPGGGMLTATPITIP